MRSKRESEAGFTLIEVMVVVLIIGILLAVGIPTFLGARERAQDRAAQSLLTVTERSASILILESGIEGADDVALTNEEPSMAFQPRGHPSRDPGDISVRSVYNGWSAATLSASGTCFFVRISTTDVVERGTIVDDFCTGAAAYTATNDGW